jgi:hypothetical protein
VRELLIEAKRIKRVRRVKAIRRRKRGSKRGAEHWHPLMRLLKKKLAARRLHNPATSRRVSLWTFRSPITPAIEKQIGRHRSRMYRRFHKLFLREADRVLKHFKRKPRYIKGI